MSILPLFGPLMTLAWPLMKGRLARGHEVGLEERMGRYSSDKLAVLRDGGAAGNFWVHAVSVGEVQAASAFIEALAASDWRGETVLSTVTVTGARNAELLMGGRTAAHIYAPWDVPQFVRAACDAVRPVAYATIETEIWPNILLELQRRKVPRFLLNARLSDRTWRAWERPSPRRAVLREMYALFDAIFARSERDAERLLTMGVDAARVFVPGDFKIDAILQRRDAASALAEALQQTLAGGERIPPRIVVAGSTHEGEDEVLLEAFALFTSPKAEADDAAAGSAKMLVIAPRHPERAGAVAELAASRGFRTALLSRVREEGRLDASVVVVDEIGVLYGLYGVASSVFIGGSLVPKGGQNILEPASWGVRVLHGPHMEDFAEATGELDAAGAAHEVRTAKEIFAHWRAATERTQPAALARIGYFARNAGAAGRAWREIERFLR